MLQSYHWFRYLGHNPKTNKYRYKYQIIDSDFEEIAIAEQPLGQEVIAGFGVIETYKKRQLPVPINLALAFKSIHEQHGTKLENTIYWNRKHNPKYLPYAEETEKQLQRIMNMKAFW